jgi:hypothetical protein
MLKMRLGEVLVKPLYLHCARLQHMDHFFEQRAHPAQGGIIPPALRKESCL